MAFGYGESDGYVARVEQHFGPDWADRASSIMPCLEYGPDYNRTVDDEWHRALSWLSKGESDYAEMAWERASRAAWPATLAERL